jgi:hypothetical protein
MNAESRLRVPSRATERVPRLRPTGAFDRMEGHLPFIDAGGLSGLSLPIKPIKPIKFIQLYVCVWAGFNFTIPPVLGLRSLALRPSVAPAASLHGWPHHLH